MLRRCVIAHSGILLCAWKLLEKSELCDLLSCQPISCLDMKVRTLTFHPLPYWSFSLSIGYQPFNICKNRSADGLKTNAACFTELAERAWKAIEEALENCPATLLPTFQASCMDFADKAEQAYKASNWLKFEMYCSLFSTMCCNNLPACMSESDQVCSSSGRPASAVAGLHTMIHTLKVSLQIQHST